MSKTFNAKQLQDLLESLFNSYMKLPYKTGRSFSDYYICIACAKIKNDSILCDCGKSSITKKPRQKRKSKKKKQIGIPRAIRLKPIL